MKQKATLLTALLLMVLTVSGCAETPSGSSSAPVSSAPASSEPASSGAEASAIETKAEPLPASNTVLNTPETAIERLKSGNLRYRNNEANTADVTASVRQDTSENGQHPYAVVVVLGHGSCGAVAAALDGHAEGNIVSIIDEIQQGIGDETDASAAEDLNIANTKNKIMESEIIQHLTESGELQVVEAKYDIETGEVEFFPVKS